MGGFHVLHRLDAATSGCICIPLTYFSQRLAIDAFTKQNVDKYYLALVFGKINEKDEITIDMPIGEDRRFYKYSRCTLKDKNDTKNPNCFNVEKATQANNWSPPPAKSSFKLSRTSNCW